MSTSHPRFTARIEGPPETIFDVIADMPNYGRWLPGSEAFGGATEVSPYPVRLGTTHLDAGPAGRTNRKQISLFELASGWMHRAKTLKTTPRRIELGIPAS